jgi:hypothetical protein
METGNVNFDLDSTTAVVCESCGGRIFKDVAVLRRVSALVSPTGKEAIVPIATFCCVSCNHLNKEFDPEHSKDLRKK